MSLLDRFRKDTQVDLDACDVDGEAASIDRVPGS